jgi:hypothetical protein
VKIGRATKNLNFNSSLELFSISGLKILCTNNSLSCNAICLHGDNTSVFIISIDLLWLENQLHDSIQKIISDEYSVPLANILLSTTHTHSCPYIDPISYENNLTQLNSVIVNSVLSAVKAANESTVKGFLNVHYTPTVNNINRRKKIVDYVSLKSFKFIKIFRNRPNNIGYVDKMSLALMFYEYPKKPIAIILNYAAHPVLSSQEKCSADYPGEISKLFKTHYNSNFVTCFLQGFSANVKPNLWEYSTSFNNRISVNLLNMLFDRKHFKKNLSPVSINDYAKSIVNEILCSEVKECINNLSISSSIINVDLELDSNNCNSQILRLHRLKLSEKLNFIAVNSEMFTEYSIWMRKFTTNNNHYLATVSCSGGMIGYIPTAKAINEGGYEVDRCLYMFGQKYRYSVNIEDSIKTSFKKLFNYG